jgi:hypothetical protein
MSFRSSAFVSSIVDERGDELVYAVSCSLLFASTVSRLTTPLLRDSLLLNLRRA